MGSSVCWEALMGNSFVGRPIWVAHIVVMSLWVAQFVGRPL